MKVVCWIGKRRVVGDFVESSFSGIERNKVSGFMGDGEIRKWGCV